ncbi:MAG: site-2 protease family protein [Chloroflexi bacterium]|nr:site-2 protease family protein [Chloroflexota bacterium]
MGFDISKLILMLLVSVPGILIAFTVHEFAHGYVAWILGDPTAKYQGRLTLNPVKHLDYMGAAVLLFSLLIGTMYGGGFIFGWAKSVPINPGRLRHPKRDSAIIAAAGAIANFTLAAVIGLLFRFGILSLQDMNIISYFCKYLVIINIALGVFNLVPVFPLDGWKVLQGFMPDDIAYKMTRLEYSNPMLSWVILGILIFSGILWFIIGPPFNFLFRLFTSPF